MRAMPPASPANILILCATSRLAQSLRWQDDRAHVAAGDAQWPTLNTATVAQWFASLAEEALLRGKAEGLLARRVLDSFQESLLWEQVIVESIPDYATSFFDVPGMATTAAEAHKLMVVWGVAPSAADEASDATDETEVFLRWRRKFLHLCAKQELIDGAQFNEAVLTLIDSGSLRLPGEVFFAGFDNITPQERRLKALLAKQGVQVTERQFDTTATPSLQIRMLPEADSERRTAAQWVAAQLARKPDAQLGIVVPNLGNARDAIESALDEALHPALLRPSCVEVPRCYNFSLGKPLTQHPLAAVALELVELCCGSGEVEQGRIGELLRHPYWSATINEADARARLDAVLREKIPATTTIGRVLSFAQWFGNADANLPPADDDWLQSIPLFDEDGEILSQPAGEEVRVETQVAPRIPVLLSHLSALESTRREWKKKALPSQWSTRIRQLLRTAGWPGERALSSHEFQARQAFFDELDKLAGLDGIVDGIQGAISARDAHHRLTQLCNAHVFQAETVNQPNVQVVGMLEAGGMHFDALWVMGMTDDVWPPMPRPNPLLPAEIQRRVGSPNASARVQLAFAASIHQRLLQCAPEITFSFARMEGATELRASPLLASYLQSVRPEPVTNSVRAELVEASVPFDRLRANGEFEQVWAEPIDDSVAPAVKEGEHVSGGTGLLKAQAICPAWAYFRYRLGAKKLQTPVEGLDATVRGSIVHEALRSFWVAVGSSSALRAMTESERSTAIDNAADAALTEYDDEHRAAPLPPVFRKLEKERLQRLLSNWLAVELQREQPFSIVSCEERIKVDIEGIVCNLQIDRIDQLEDGRRIVIDYKTGAVSGVKSWADMRIADPQLPIYAAIAQSGQTTGGETAAVAFARVQLDDSTFLGIASEDGLLPRVPGVGSRDGRKVFSADEFADWQAVLRHWRSSIHEIALEVKFGAAAVQVADEADLRYCDVLPILRLAERRAQWEAGLSGDGAAHE